MMNNKFRTFSIVMYICMLALLTSGCTQVFESETSKLVQVKGPAEITQTPVDLFKGDGAKFQPFLGAMSGAFKLRYEGNKPNAKLDIDIWKNGKKVATSGSIGDLFFSSNKIIFNRLKELPRHLYNQEIQSVFPSVSKVMAHIYNVDCAWLDIFMGKSMKDAIEDSFQLQEDAEARSLEELEVMYDVLSVRFKAFINEHEDLEKEVVLDNPYAGVLNTRYSEFIIQVVNHGTYHRGNLSAMLRQMGHSSVMTEYGLFMYKDESNSSMPTAPAN